MTYPATGRTLHERQIIEFLCSVDEMWSVVENKLTIEVYPNQTLLIRSDSAGIEYIHVNNLRAWKVHGRGGQINHIIQYGHVHVHYTGNFTLAENLV